jgi:hypothetical protein
MVRCKPTKRERIDQWLHTKQVGYRFYAKQLGKALGLTTAEVAIYLQWHKMVQHLGNSLAEPNWEVVKGVGG